jgi:hypothetical protein
VFRYGDAQTVYRNTRPTTERAERWREVIRASPVWTNWAHGYLHALGREVVTGLGYDYDALEAQIGEPAKVGVTWAQATGTGG